ncbi:unnamed protein product [Closterium sp. NIES-53]
MYLMTCTRPDLAYPLSILARFVAHGRHRPEHMAAAKRVLRYLCSTSVMGLVLGGRRPSTCSSSVLSSSCEAEIYAGAMAAQELRWLTYLLTDLGEQPRSPPVLYVDNKAMLALCREHRLEHRTKHIALRYFLARELQQRGQLRLAYVASEANTADIFTKALAPGDHQRFCTMLACFALLDWSSKFIATCAATHEGLYLQELLDEEIFVTPNQFTLQFDNQSAITIANKPGFVNRTKHISLRYFFVKDAIDKGRMRLVYCPTSNMAADSLTKKLTGQKFHHCNQLSGISESTG